MHFKLAFKRARPSQLNPKLYPAILVPAHYSFPSGHSTQSHAVEEALNAVFEGTNVVSLKYHLNQTTRDVSENREWAGVHYASDTLFGEDLGKEIWKLGLSKSEVFVKLLADAKQEWR